MMHIQVNSNNSIDLDENLIRQITALVEPELKHYREDVTGVEVYVNDTNSDKGGNRDKHCTIEAHVAGMEPLAASSQASDVLLAVKQGSRKLHRVLSSRLQRRRDARVVDKGALIPTVLDDGPEDE